MSLRQLLDFTQLQGMDVCIQAKQIDSPGATARVSEMDIWLQESPVGLSWTGVAARNISTTLWRNTKVNPALLRCEPIFHDEQRVKSEVQPERLPGAVYRNEVYFSNRAAALTSLRRFPAAVADSKKVIQLRPKWVKGYSRLAAAHFGNEDYSEVSLLQTSIQLEGVPSSEAQVILVSSASRDMSQANRLLPMLMFQPRIPPSGKDRVVLIEWRFNCRALSCYLACLSWCTCSSLLPMQDLLEVARSALVQSECLCGYLLKCFTSAADIIF